LPIENFRAPVTKHRAAGTDPFTERYQTGEFHHLSRPSLLPNTGSQPTWLFGNWPSVDLRAVSKNKKQASIFHIFITGESEGEKLQAKQNTWEAREWGVIAHTVVHER
jgi:hypothetical protein